ncbi:P83/100 family protein [Thiospirochaeta perfilievii]|uniref:P83/100 family protein n=1 Tax=Thiospirochaeta perfilievii TaxID=252967 RepID=UPI001658EB03|nr:P83/100 family protein [Thiospirochaeta perfilievii]
MKKLLILLVLSLYSNLFSVTVDKLFLEATKSENLQFENYIGPYLFYNSIGEIRSIGTYLAKEISTEIKSDANYSDKYKMYHRPKLEWEENIMSCDVFEITSKALIDNSNNIELIISQYIMDSYGYNIDDADLLAHLILMYNAAYRLDQKHYSDYYTTESIISTENLGIDLSYYNWPGKTYIYIPLSNNISFGKLSNIDSDILVEDKIIEKITVDDTNNIEIREDIIEYKERELEEVIENLDELKESLNQIEQPNQPNEPEIINDKVEEKPEDVAAKELKKEILKVQEDILEKDEKIVELRDNLADDKNEQIVEIKKTNSSSNFKYIMNRVNGDSYSGIIVNLDQDGNIINKSSVNSIKNNTFSIKADYLYIIAGGSNSNQIITLGRLSAATLDNELWGAVPCYEKSPIFISGKNIYVLIVEEGKYYLGEFDLDLNLVRKNSEPVYKDSFIVLKSDTFYIQGLDNNIKLVNLSDFSSD